MMRERVITRLTTEVIEDQSASWLASTSRNLVDAAKKATDAPLVWANDVQTGDLLLIAQEGAK